MEGKNPLALLGSSFTKNSQNVDARSVSSAYLVGIYFSASWSVPCIDFTDILTTAYKSINQGKQLLEIISVPGPQLADAYNAFMSRIPWLSFSREDPHIEALKLHFNVLKYPTLVILQQDGTVVAADAYASVKEKGAAFFRDKIPASVVESPPAKTEVVVASVSLPQVKTSRKVGKEMGTTSTFDHYTEFIKANLEAGCSVNIKSIELVFMEGITKLAIVYGIKQPDGQIVNRTTEIKGELFGDQDNKASLTLNEDEWISSIKGTSDDMLRQCVIRTNAGKHIKNPEYGEDHIISVMPDNSRVIGFAGTIGMFVETLAVYYVET